MSVNKYMGYRGKTCIQQSQKKHHKIPADVTPNYGKDLFRREIPLKLFLKQKSNQKTPQDPCRRHSKR